MRAVLAILLITLLWSVYGLRMAAGKTDENVKISREIYNQAHRTYPNKHIIVVVLK